MSCACSQAQPGSGRNGSGQAGRQAANYMRTSMTRLSLACLLAPPGPTRPRHDSGTPPPHVTAPHCTALLCTLFSVVVEESSLRPSLSHSPCPLSSLTTLTASRHHTLPIAWSIVFRASSFFVFPAGRPPIVGAAPRHFWLLAITPSLPPTHTSLCSSCTPSPSEPPLVCLPPLAAASLPRVMEFNHPMEAERVNQELLAQPCAQPDAGMCMWCCRELNEPSAATSAP